MRIVRTTVTGPAGEEGGTAASGAVGTVRDIAPDTLPYWLARGWKIDANDDGVADEAAAAGAYQPVRGARAMALGDSITANGVTSQAPAGVTGLQPWVWTNGQNWLLLACLLSQGRLQYAGLAGTSGYTTTQILATHLPTVLAQRPSWCFEMGGTNDPSNSVPFATTVANLTSIYTQLLTAGITPVLCGLMPRSAYATNAGVHTQINAWKQRYAQQHGLPFIDFFAAMIDATGATGNYDTGLSDDGLHPNATGAYRMAQAIVSQFVNSTELPPPHLIAYNANDSTLQQVGSITGNNLFLTDTNADGVPDEWSVVQGSAAYNFDSDPLVLGKFWRINRTTDAILTRGYNGFTAGHRYYFACKVKAAIPSGGAAAISVISADFAVRLFRSDFAVSMPTGVLAVEFTVPTGMSNANCQLRADVSGAGTQLSLGQTTLIDLTAKGIV